MSTLKEIAFSKEELLKCKGFIENFIDDKITVSSANILNKDQKKILPKVEGNKNGILNYTNLSVHYNSNRKIPFFSAYNINGADKKDKISRANSFHHDPRIPKEVQLSEDFYSFKYKDSKTGKFRIIFEIGHVAAHNEMTWGNDAQIMAYRTFHFPNSFPQAEILNSGLWRSLENYIINETSEIDKNKKISVFTGPFILDSDPVYKNVENFQIPILFFKVVVFSTEKGIYSTAFVMSHEKKIKELGIIESKEILKRAETVTEFSDFKYKKVFQVDIDFLQKQSGLNFTWKGVKKIKIKDQINQLQLIKDTGNADDAGKKLKPEDKKSTLKLNLILP
ncbi:DNA/RNA non-specific endonuclease [Halpernia frigidisoli]|uniref:DNA/RNA endonuclease G, NUC1 n=1 Tax=Halpernia frigidisoli TaxID=1125876 RepID=A0A1I3FLF7_9FLAO|nr:DNA/RNA non-specific endonuclease [Halpernia frigidisoli]SFI12088.1 DNA/RNA endonuclease G, NUC1 [Halpernia frigidisoli]